jgi:hypothetical protein
MKAARRWLLYQIIQHQDGKKPRKVPHYVNGQRRQITDTREDLEQLVSFTEAKAALGDRSGDWGLGFALGYDDTLGEYWQGHDRDGSLEGADTAPGYVEKSPSGTGYHVLGLGRDFKARKKDGREFYSHGRFFTFTGDQILDGPIVDLMTVYPELEKTEPMPAGLPTGHSVEKLSSRQRADLRDALAALDADDYDVWYRVALALQSVEDGFVLFEQWSRWSDKFNADEVRKKWEHAAGKAHAHWKSILVWAANDFGWVNPASAREQKEPSQPYVWRKIDVIRPKPDKYVFPAFIGQGLTFLVGEPGVGKTSLLTSLLCMVAGLRAPPSDIIWRLPPRKVFVISENADRVENILRGMNLFGDIARPDELGSMFHLTDALQLSAVEISARLNELTVAFTTQATSSLTGQPYDILPLGVLDTFRTNLKTDDEKDNSEMSKAIALLRQRSSPCPMIVVGHSVKASWGKDGLQTISGAGAATGDSDGTITATADTHDRDTYYLTVGKTRVGVPNPILRITTERTSETCMTDDGEAEQHYQVPRHFAFMSREDKAQEKDAKDKANERRDGDQAVWRLRWMLANGGVVFGIKKGAPPTGYLKKSFRDDVLRPLNISNRRELTMKELLKSKFKHRIEGDCLFFERFPFAVGGHEVRFN